MTVLRELRILIRRKKIDKAKKIRMNEYEKIYREC